MNNHRLSQRIRVIVLIAVAALFIITIPAQASVCTLADHIRSANTNTAVGFCPAGTSHDIITIADDITLTEPLPPITGTITIEGGGHTISGDGQFRIFDVNGGNLTIKNLTMRDGKAEFGGAVRIRGGSEAVISHSTLSHNEATFGGAIAQMGNQWSRLTIDSSSFLNNRAEWHAGVLDITGGTVTVKNSSFMENYSDDYGGVMTIANSDSAVRVENSTFYGNSAQWDGGVVYHFSGDLTLTHVTMSDNRLNPGYTGAGRAISNNVSDPSDGTLNLLNSIVTGSGPNCVGGLDQISGNLSPDGSCAYEPGGAPRLGALTGSPAYLPLLDNSSAVDRADPDFCLEADQIGTPRPQGGGCDIGAIESMIAAPAPTATPTICTLQDQIIAANTDKAYRSCPAGNGADIIYMVRDYVLSEPLAPIKTDITIEGNGHTINGGNRFLIFNVDGGRLTVNNATLTRGRGAIKLANGGRAIANDVSFIANGSHGAISSRQAAYIEVNNSSFIRNSSGLDGGAIGMNGGGVAKIKNSSFVGNSSVYRGGAIGSMSGSLDISNSSFIGNRAQYGGAISAAGSAGNSYVPVWLTHLTMLDNSASGNGAALWLENETYTKVAMRLRNSILAGISSRGRKLCSGRLSQNLHNLIEDGTCSPMFSGDPMMEEADESATMVAPSAGSPAIDAGHPEVCPDTDQIGTARPLGNGCDLGAIEVMPVVETLTDCRVTPTHNLNFRDGPWGNIIGAASNTTTFTAKARTPGWFAVEDETEGRSGWISADYVVTEGDCS